jgi:hypothetical protein
MGDRVGMMRMVELIESAGSMRFMGMTLFQAVDG